MNEIKALIYGLRIFPIEFESACFVNGVFDLELSDVLPMANTVMITPLFQVAESFKSHQYKVQPDFKENDNYDSCFVFLPKQRDHALYDVAMSLRHMRDGGSLVLCAANDAGGRRILDILKVFGLEPLNVISRHHCKFASAIKTSSLSQEAVDYCIENGGVKKGKHGYLAKPGIFGWNKIDKGSALLIESLSESLSGRGADFGCGYGYVVDQVLSKNASVSGMMCFDADYYAVQACKLNLRDQHKDRNYSVEWADLTVACPVTSLSFIVMNPPFHEGKGQDISLGKNMIATAHKALGKCGVLYMVANNHLPYERVLNDLFFKVDVVIQRNGFKVFMNNS